MSMKCAPSCECSWILSEFLTRTVRITIRVRIRAVVYNSFHYYNHTLESNGFPIPPKLAKLIEDWSTDEDLDDFDSDDEDEEDYDDYEDEEELRGALNKSENQGVDAETRRKLKNAKKKAEKRRKLKEKKQKEKMGLPLKAEDTVDSMSAHEEAMR